MLCVSFLTFPDSQILASAPRLNVSPKTATPGQEVTATGARFPARSKGRLVWTDNGRVLTEFETRQDGPVVAATVHYDAAAHKAILDPETDLVQGTTYVAKVTTAATDLAGNRLADDYVWSFTAPLMVTASVETAPVPHGGDAADDPAIWVDPDDPARSVVIGTDKLGGLAVYDLAGEQLAYYPGGEPNNVDLRQGFPLGGELVALVVASDAEADALRAYRVDPATRGLVEVTARPLEIGMGASGLCLYAGRGGKHYAFVSDSSGTVQQWELSDDGTGKVDASKVRTLSLGSTTEGCVADDRHGNLFVAEEDVGIWKYGAEPEAGDARIRVDSVGDSGHLTADIEGLALYEGSDGGGYLLASSQNDNAFVVYQRDGDHAYVATFTIAAGAIDEVSYTDGIDVTSAALGSAFPEGLFVAQDDDNDDGNQNFKLVPWDAIAPALTPSPATD
jgi:3-phytase